MTSGDDDWLAIAEAGEAPPGAVVVDGAQCRTRAGLFTAWAGALSFPGHFGRNWDAFYDCLTDLPAVTIVVTNSGDLLADEPPAQRAAFLDAVRDAATGRLLGDGDEVQPPRLRLELRT